MAISFLPLQPQQMADFQVSLVPELVSAIDRWRKDQNPVQDFGQALASLSLIALAQAGYVPQSQSEADPQVEALVAAFEAAAD